jgi:hypothetical protein
MPLHELVAVLQTVIFEKKCWGVGGTGENCVSCPLKALSSFDECWGRCCIDVLYDLVERLLTAIPDVVYCNECKFGVLEERDGVPCVYCRNEPMAWNGYCERGKRR